VEIFSYLKTQYLILFKTKFESCKIWERFTTMLFRIFYYSLTN